MNLPEFAVDPSQMVAWWTMVLGLDKNSCLLAPEAKPFLVFWLDVSHLCTANSKDAVANSAHVDAIHAGDCPAGSA